MAGFALRTRVGPLERADRERLDAHGYLLLRAAVPAPWIEPLRAAFDTGETPNEAWPIPRGVDWRHALVDLDPTVQRTCRLPNVLAAAGQLIGGPFQLGQVEGREPRAGGGQQTLHRDAGEGGPMGMVSALVFLDAYGAANGGTRVLAGTHRGPGLALAEGVDHAGAEVLEGEAGDILVFDGATLHSATLNRCGARRRSLLMSFVAQPLMADYEATRELRSVRMDTSELFEPDLTETV